MHNTIHIISYFNTIKIQTFTFASIIKLENIQHVTAAITAGTDLHQRQQAFALEQLVVNTDATRYSLTLLMERFSMTRQAICVSCLFLIMALFLMPFYHVCVFLHLRTVLTSTKRISSQ